MALKSSRAQKETLTKYQDPMVTSIVCQCMMVEEEKREGNGRGILFAEEKNAGVVEGKRRGRKWAEGQDDCRDAGGAGEKRVTGRGSGGGGEVEKNGRR